ncbi:MAG: ECF transporter S component [Clostridiales bacterium]|nr:ECF transporter S component [Clostridiales bacterium]
MNEKKFFSTRNITYLAVLMALVILFQVLSSFMKIGEASLCLVLVPIVLGGILLGVKAGIFLGLTFSIVVLISLLGNPLSMAIMAEHPVFFPLSTLFRGMAAGVVPALLFKLVAKKNKYVATFVAAAAAPIVNTGIFILSMLAMSGALMNVMGDAYPESSALYVIIVVLVSFNFFIEFALNIILSPAIFTVTKVVERRRNRG